MSGIRRHLLFTLIIIALSFIVYFNTLKNGFVYDDTWEIVNNNWIQNFANLFSSCHRYRVTQYADYKIWGLNPFGFHLTNLLLNTLVSISVYFLVHIMLRKKFLAFITATLFTLHPVHTEAVSIVSHRQEILAMLFMLLGLIFYIKQKNAKNHWSLALSIIFFGLSLSAKEVAFVFPLLLILYDLYFDKYKIKIKNYIPYLVLLGLFLVIFSLPSPRWNFKISGYDAVSFGHALSGNRTYASILLTQLKGFTQYVKLIVLPVRLNIDYYFPMYNSIFQDGLLLCLMLLFLLVFLAVITFRRYRIISFGLIWFLISLLPVLNILPKTYFVAERYLYIPSMGFCLILGWLFSELYTRKTTRVISGLVLVIILIFYSFSTIKRNFDFKSEYTLWSATLKSNPRSVFGHNNVGIGLLESGKTQDAMKEFETTIQLAPTFAKPYYNLGVAYYKTGDNNDAIENLKTAIRLDPKSAETYAALGTVYQSIGLFDSAVSNFEIALQDCNLAQDASLHYSLGVVYRGVGKNEKAISEFKRATMLNPKLSEAHNDLGIEFARESLYNEAIKEFEIALTSSNQPSQIYYNLGLAYMNKGEYNKAIQYFQNLLKYQGRDTINIERIHKLIENLKIKNAQH
jgi:tetratricopeptide (TPR) repeat protein